MHELSRQGSNAYVAYGHPDRGLLTTKQGDNVSGHPDHPSHPDTGLTTRWFFARLRDVRYMSSPNASGSVPVRLHSVAVKTGERAIRMASQ